MSNPKLMLQRQQLMMKDRMRSNDLELIQMKNNQCVSRSLLFQRFPQRNKQRTLKRPAEVPAESSSIKKGKAAQPKQVCWYNYFFTSFRPRLLLSKMRLKKKRDLSLRQSQLQSGERRYIHSFSCSFREIAMMRRRSRVLKSKEDPLVPYRYLAPEGN